eukprot:6200429-Pleurochrysis_carterae.AAC.1
MQQNPQPHDELDMVLPSRLPWYRWIELDTRKQQPETRAKYVGCTRLQRTGRSAASSSMRRPA